MQRTRCFGCRLTRYSRRTPCAQYRGRGATWSRVRCLTSVFLRELLRHHPTLEAASGHAHTVVVTLEPCVMCAGALLSARVARVVFGADDPKGGAAGSLYNVFADPRLNHEIALTLRVRAEECGSPGIHRSPQAGKVFSS